jgi:hypothetical protein
MNKLKELTDAENPVHAVFDHLSCESVVSWEYSEQEDIYRWFISSIDRDIKSKLK